MRAVVPEDGNRETREAGCLRALKILTLTVVVLCSGLVLLVWGAFRSVDKYYGDDLRFNRARWLAKTKWKPVDGSHELIARAGMVDDLIDHHLRNGMTREEVQILLGRPDGSNDHRATNGVWYDLGDIHSFTMDPAIVTIEFDSNGRVVRFWVWDT